MTKFCIASSSQGLAVTDISPRDRDFYYAPVIRSLGPLSPAGRFQTGIKLHSQITASNFSGAVYASVHSFVMLPAKLRNAGHDGVALLTGSKRSRAVGEPRDGLGITTPVWFAGVVRVGLRAAVRAYRPALGEGWLDVGNQ